MKTGANAVPHLLLMGRGLGGEAAGESPTHELVSPSASDGEGAGGEAAIAPPASGSDSPSPLVERGLGGEVVDCFRAGTQVKTQIGWRSIETISIGDMV